MVHRASIRPADDSAIQGPYRAALYLLSVLIACIGSGKLFAQSDPSGYEPITIERSEVLRSFFSEDLLLSKSCYKIIHFGDSHIQGDIITGEIRKNLKRETHPAGTGLIFPLSLCGSFGPAGVKSSISGNYTWSTYLKNPENRPIGVCGYEISLQAGASMRFGFNESFKGSLAKQFDVWIYSADDSEHLELAVPGAGLNREKIDNNLYLYHFSIDSVRSVLEFSIKRNCSFWGLEFLPEHGLIYQQNGLVGAQFHHLIKSKEDIIGQLSRLNPDMIVFSYGTNEAYSNVDSLAYQKKVASFLGDLAEKMPQTGILVTNAPDTRSSGRIPAGQMAVNAGLANAARQLNLPFFDWNRAMGGWGSLYKWEKSNLFLSDLLHFNKTGAFLVGDLFSYALLESGNFTGEKRENLKTSIKTRMNDILKGSGKALITKEPEVKKQDSVAQATVIIPEKKAKEKTAPSAQLKVPKKKQEKPPVRIYVVKNGDNLGAVARKVKSTIAKLVKLNQLKSPDKLSIGQKLRY
jgi:LysM repeat protein